MSVFVLADLHLSLSCDKPMDVFGGSWNNYTEKLLDNWQSTVKPEDTVVIPGDISWGMNLEESKADLQFIQNLNGKKLIGKGNHDYWWQTMKKLQEFTREISASSIHFLYNNAYLCENIIVCGTRGWFVEKNYSPDDEKIVNREAERLKLSLGEAKKLKNLNPEAEIVVFLHYPPAYNGIICEKIADVLAQNEIKRCFYGHLHCVSSNRLTSSIGNTRLYCISSDYINFKPMKIN